MVLVVELCYQDPSWLISKPKLIKQKEKQESISSKYGIPNIYQIIQIIV
jgi:hypothetical protein